MKPLGYEEHKETYDAFYKACEEAYFKLIEEGCRPDEARSVLPNSLKASIMVTCSLEEWKIIFALRMDEHALGALQIARGNRHARKVRIGLEDEACRLELVPARDDAQRPALLPVRRLPVGEPHLVAQRRNSPVIKLRRLRFTRGKSHARDAKRRQRDARACQHHQTPGGGVG